MTGKECQEGEIKSEGKCVLPVVFRKWKGGEPIALFPSLAWDERDNVGSYQHTGQHSGATYSHVVSQTTSATPKEYKPLMKELHKAGYRKLKVYGKQTEAMRRERRKAQQRWARM